MVTVPGQNLIVEPGDPVAERYNLRLQDALAEAASLDLTNTLYAPSTLGGVAGVTGSVPDRAASRLTIYAADYGVTAGSSSYASANSSIINALMSGLAGIGGGVLVLPPGDVYIAATLDNKYPRVVVMGKGADFLHDAGVSTAANPMYGTRLIATTATTMCKLRTPYYTEQGVAVANTWRYTGGGFKNLSLNGGGVATAAMLIDSVAWADVDIYATNFNASQVVTVQCGVSGTDLGEVCDVSNCSLVFKIRLIDTAADQAANGVMFTGSSNANVCLNQRVIINGQWKNGILFKGVSCDNNHIWLQGTRSAGGTGAAVRMYGPTATHPTGGEWNFFHYINNPSSALIYAEGTDTGGVLSGIYNRITNQDTANGGALPTVGTGSSWGWEDSKNVLMGKASGPWAFSNDRLRAVTQRAAIVNETIRIDNQSADHVRLTDGTNEWSLNIDGSGNLRLTKVSGSGSLTLGGTSPLSHNILSSSTPYASDALAAAGGVAVGQLYRTASAVQIRVT